MEIKKVAKNGPTNDFIKNTLNLFTLIYTDKVNANCEIHKIY